MNRMIQQLKEIENRKKNKIEILELKKKTKQKERRVFFFCFGNKVFKAQ